MIVNIDQITAGIIKYIDSEVAPKATGITKFAVYFVAPSVPKYVASLMASLKENTLFSDIFDENGNVKLDEVYSRANTAISKSGKLYIEKFNFFIDNTDVEILYNLIKNS